MYVPRTPPFDHQRMAVERSRDRGGFAFFMEMGTGKTKVALDEAGEKFTRGEITGLLITAPKGVCHSWVREAGVHLGCPHRIMVWSSGANKTDQKKLEKLCEPDSTQLTIVVMNIEAFGAGKKAPEYARKFLVAHSAGMAVDESQTIKSPTAKRTKTIMQIGSLAAYRRILTGSPAPNSPMDLYSQLEFIVPGSTGQRSFYGFRSRYAVLQEKIFGGRKVKVEVGYRNTDELRDITLDHSYRVRKDECLDLPAKIYMPPLEVDLTTEQSRVYREISEEALATVGNSFTSSQSAITTLIRLQQVVCGYVRDDDGGLHYLNSNRVSAVHQVAESCGSDMIIWVGQHTPMIPVITESLREKYGEESCAVFYGGNTGERVEEARRFVEDEECRFMVVTQASGARGNTWLNGRMSLYFANTYNLEERLQSEDRSHRAGQSSSTMYQDLAAQGVNIDNRLIKALRSKEQMSSALMGESARNWI